MYFCTAVLAQWCSCAVWKLSSYLPVCLSVYLSICLFARDRTEVSCEPSTPKQQPANRYTSVKAVYHRHAVALTTFGQGCAGVCTCTVGLFIDNINSSVFISIFRQPGTTTCVNCCAEQYSYYKYVLINTVTLLPLILYGPLNSSQEFEKSNVAFWNAKPWKCETCSLYLAQGLPSLPFVLVPAPAGILRTAPRVPLK